jgi:hypothetical protein
MIAARGAGSDEPLFTGAAPPSPGDVPKGVGVLFGEQDNSWVEAFGGEVTRPSPPVGSIAMGIPGIGFDLVLPDGTIAESYGPDGRRLGPGELAVVNLPEIASEPDDGQGKAQNEPTGA